MELRNLRKVPGRSNALMTVYECDSCLWTINLTYEKSSDEVQVKFDGHDCIEKPLRKSTRLVVRFGQETSASAEAPRTKSTF